MSDPHKIGVYTSYRFWIELKGITEGLFSECSGLQVETEIFEWEAGGVNGFKYRFPGRSKYPNLVLKRGIASDELWKWYFGVLSGKDVQRHDLSILLNGYAGMQPIRWNVMRALPIKWSGPTLKADANETAVETIELVHEGFERV